MIVSLQNFLHLAQNFVQYRFLPRFLRHRLQETGSLLFLQPHLQYPLESLTISFPHSLLHPVIKRCRRGNEIILGMILNTLSWGEIKIKTIKQRKLCVMAVDCSVIWRWEPEECKISIQCWGQGRDSDKNLPPPTLTTTGGLAWLLLALNGSINNLYCFLTSLCSTANINRQYQKTIIPINNNLIHWRFSDHNNNNNISIIKHLSQFSSLSTIMIYSIKMFKVLKINKDSLKKSDQTLSLITSKPYQKKQIYIFFVSRLE